MPNKYRITHVAPRQPWEPKAPQDLGRVLVVRLVNQRGNLTIETKETMKPGDVGVHVFDGEIIRVTDDGKQERGCLIDLSGAWGVAIQEGHEDDEFAGLIGGGPVPRDYFNVIAKGSLS